MVLVGLGGEYVIFVGWPAFAEASCGICGVRAECGRGMRGICGVVGLRGTNVRGGVT